MKRWNVVTLRHALQRGVQDLVTDPENPLPFHAAGDTVLKVEPADGASGIPRHTIRRCRLGVVSLKGNKPVRAAETVDGATAPAAALNVALETAVHDGLAQMFIPLTGVGGFTFRGERRGVSGESHINPFWTTLPVILATKWETLTLSWGFPRKREQQFGGTFEAIFMLIPALHTPVSPPPPDFWPRQTGGES